jgi:probable HAF family extracellular repeat protein
MKRLLAVAVAVLVGNPIQAGTVSYEITDLGFRVQLGGSPVINNARQIAGNRVFEGQTQGLLWENGTITNLGILPDEHGAPTAINDRGQIALSGAWIWDGGTMTDLGALPGQTFAVAFGINNNGQVVGYSYGGGLDDQGFLWDNGTMIGLGNLGGGDSVARAINNSGRIVGYSRTAQGNTQPFLWQNSVMTPLEIFQLGDWAGAAAVDINDAGLVVGSGDTAANHLHALLWENGSVIDLGTLPGDTLSSASAINNLGQIVGASQRAGSARATLWEDGGIHDLNDLVMGDWSLIQATDINDLGEIVGIGVNPQGDKTTFLLAPAGNVTPEPSTRAGLFSLAIVVGINCVWRRCRRRIFRQA